MMNLAYMEGPEDLPFRRPKVPQHQVVDWLLLGEAVLAAVGPAGRVVVGPEARGETCYSYMDSCSKNLNSQWLQSIQFLI